MISTSKQLVRQHDQVTGPYVQDLRGSIRVKHGFSDYSQLELALRFLVGHSPQQLAVDSPNVQQSVAVSFGASRQHREKLKAAGYGYNHEFVVVPSRGAARWLLPLANPAATVRG